MLKTRPTEGENLSSTVNNFYQNLVCDMSIGKCSKIGSGDESYHANNTTQLYVSILSRSWYDQPYLGKTVAEAYRNGHSAEVRAVSSDDSPSLTSCGFCSVPP